MKKFTQVLGLALMALMLVSQTALAQTRVTLSFVGSDGSAVRQLEATLGEDFTEPRLVISPADAGVRVVYSSTNTNVATVDMMSGEVTLLSAGTTSIMAQSGQTEEYTAGRASYSLTVNEASTPPTPTPTCPEAHFNLSADNVLHMTVGDVVSIPDLLGGAGSILPLSARTVEGILVAELTEDNMIHAVGQGTAQFIGLYIQAGTDGTTLQCEYSFDIIVSGATPQKLDPQLSFSATEVNVELGDEFVAPQLINPNNIELTPANSKWEAPWNSTVASVNEQTGEVTILGVGDETISLEFLGNDTYQPAIISYTIHVTTMGLTVGGVTVNNGNAEDIFGNGTAWYDAPHRTLYLNGFIYTGQQIATGGPAHVKAGGSGANAAISYTNHETLTIMVQGASEIRNAEMCIYAPNSPVVMMGNGRGGYMTMEATMVAINAKAFKIHQCWLSASGTSAALALGQSLGISRGSYLLANSNGVAIQCQTFEKTQEVIEGYEINILTEGVYFNQPLGFYDSSNKFAKTVEIGKVVVVPTTTEVTTIDFTQTDPEGNETVIFSGSVNDTFNESTGQLEISTRLTDEQVATAMETLIPGSSAWIEMLPGSLVFDIPAGTGKVRIQCQTISGYTLQVKLGGQTAVSLTQVELGWAEVSYNVPEPIHVVIYLHATSGSVPARFATSNKEDNPTTGAYIQAVKIAPTGAPDPNPSTAIDIIDANKGENGKIMMNSQLYIIREGRVFTATGAQVK